jgi:hypothetical protein
MLLVVLDLKTSTLVVLGHFHLALLHLLFFQRHIKQQTVQHSHTVSHSLKVMLW